MPTDLDQLDAFVVIADEASFTRAALRLGTSPSALSHAMRSLEARLGIRLLTRTTRRVATTAAGEQLLGTLRPALHEIRAELSRLGTLRDVPAGTVRITLPKHAAELVVWPMLPGFLRRYPDIRVELTVDEGLTDIVADRHDAGIRFGEKVAKDMVAWRVGPAIRSVVVGSPAYFAELPAPESPRDLAGHRCLNYRLATSGALYPWEFEEEGRSFEVKVDGPLVFNDGDLILAAALAGMGLAYLFEDQVADHVAAGRLVPALTEWCWDAPGYYLYYPGRRQTPPALAAFVAALRAGG